MRAVCVAVVLAAVIAYVGAVPVAMTHRTFTAAAIKPPLKNGNGNYKIGDGFSKIPFLAAILEGPEITVRKE
jgi:hypothetical protein